MAKYYVSIPFTGYCTVEVEAESKEDAIEAAWESPDLDFRKAEECDFHDQVTQGNVSYAVLDKIEVKDA